MSPVILCVTDCASTTTPSKTVNAEAVSNLIQFLDRFDPPWVLMILAVAILCYRAPDIVRAFRAKR
jgi:hypothetical protein